MEQLIFSLNATLPIFLVMIIGYVLRMLHVVDEPFIKTLNSFNYKVTLPVLLFRDIAESDFYSVWDTKYVCFCFLATLVCISVIWLSAGLLYQNRTQLGSLFRLPTAAAPPCWVLHSFRISMVPPAWRL